MKLSFHAFDLQLKYPFSIANFSRTSTPIMLVQIEHEGLIGYGEASMPPYLGENHQTATDFLRKVDLNQFSSPGHLAEILSYVDSLSAGNPAAKASIDIALHDLLGKLNKRPCYNLFKADPQLMPATSCTIGIDSVEVVRKKVLEADQFKFLKVKLGGPNDKDMIEAIRSITNKAIYVDANQGWKNKNEALEMIHWLAERNVLFVEQPLSKANVDDNAWVTENSPLPVLADEAVQCLADVEKVNGCYDGINIKLMKCTGMQEAHQMIQRARQLNLKVMMGCMSETACAIMAAAALAPLCDYVDLDGPWMTINKPFQDPELRDGKIVLTEETGLGIQFAKEMAGK